MASGLRRLLIIGGTGTLGSAILHKLLATHAHQFDSIRILSRNEHRQKWMERNFKPLAQQVGVDLDFFLGDIGDRDRVFRACRHVTDVFHLAAIKHVDKAEYNPHEAVRTNVIGTINIIDACIHHDVQRAIFTSTDKAVEPFNTYGFSKALAESLWVAGNMGLPTTRFSAVRYGNVFGSQGSVVELWRNLQTLGKPLTITHPEATRFFISIGDAAKLVYNAWSDMQRGEVFIPKMKATALLPLVNLFDGKFTVTGMGPGEKMHEALVSPHEAHRVYESNGYFVKMPSYHFFDAEIPTGATPFPGGKYTSDIAPQFTKDELKIMLAEVMGTWTALGFTNSAATT